MFKTSAVPPRLGQSAVGSPARHRHYRRGTAMTAVVPYKDRSSTSITAVHPQYNRRAIAKKSRLAIQRRSRGFSTAVMAVLPRCYHITGPAVLPRTPQSCRQWSPWHRRQTAVVTPWDRYVRSDNAVVPPHREEENVWRVETNFEKLLAVSLRWWRFWPKTVVAPRLRCDGGIRYDITLVLGLALSHKAMSILLAIFVLTPFWVAVRGKAILKIACIGNSVLGKPEVR